MRCQAAWLHFTSLHFTRSRVSESFRSGSLASRSGVVVPVWHEGKRAAPHERSYGRYEKVLDPEHYLDVLE